MFVAVDKATLIGMYGFLEQEEVFQYSTYMIISN